MITSLKNNSLNKEKKRTANTEYVQSTAEYLVSKTNMEAVFLSQNPHTELIPDAVGNAPARDNTLQSEGTTRKTNTFQIKTEKQGTITVVEHFSGNQTYIDVIKAALRRQFAE